LLSTKSYVSKVDKRKMFKPELNYSGGVSPPSPKGRAEREHKV
jgi:hypothetical protein